MNALRPHCQPNPTAALLRAGARLTGTALAHRLNEVTACEAYPGDRLHLILPQTVAA